MTGPPYGVTHAEAQIYTSRTDAVEGAPNPYLGILFKALNCRDSLPGGEFVITWLQCGF